MDISLYTGDSRNLIINVVDANSSIIDLTGANVEWVLISSQNAPVLSKMVGSGITINNPSGGQFTIDISSNDTRALIAGSYQQMGRVTTSDGSSSIVLTGSVTIQASLI